MSDIFTYRSLSSNRSAMPTPGLRLLILLLVLISSLTTIAKPDLPLVANKTNRNQMGLTASVFSDQYTRTAVKPVLPAPKITEAPPTSICISNTCELAGGITLTQEIYTSSLKLYSAYIGNNEYYFGYVTGNPGFASFTEPKWYVYGTTNGGSLKAYYSNDAPSDEIPTSGWQAVETNCPEFTMTFGACPAASSSLSVSAPASINLNVTGCPAELSFIGTGKRFVVTGPGQYGATRPLRAVVPDVLITIDRIVLAGTYTITVTGNTGQPPYTTTFLVTGTCP